MIVALRRWIEQASELFRAPARSELCTAAGQLSAAKLARSAQPVRRGHLAACRISIKHGID